jgi:nicotinamidase-related amidase
MTLLVIDMQVGFFDHHAALAARRAPLSAAINDLARALRASGQPVIWIRQEFQPDLTDAPLEARRLASAVTIAGTDGCRLLPELERDAADGVVIKKRYSAFFGTDLEETLAGLQPRSLVLAGINTHACVRTTAIDAYQRDYDVILATDCVASHDIAHHDVTLRYFDRKIATLMTNAEIVRLLEAESERV